MKLMRKFYKLLLGSFTGRVAAMLTLGMAAASLATLFLADYARIHDFLHAQQNAVVNGAADLSSRFANHPAEISAQLDRRAIFGAGNAPPRWGQITPDPAIGKLLTAKLGRAARPEAMLMPHGACFPSLDLRNRIAGIPEKALPECWHVRFRDAQGIERDLMMDIGAIGLPKNSTLGPLYPIIIVAVSAALAFVITRLVTSPLRALRSAARAFSVTIDPEPLPERGPSEVRAALQTFNIMQDRVRDHVRDRTRILASIAHDLQTPITRLRLRLEQIEDDVLKERLVCDLADMQRLVRDGLDLARSGESREQWSIVDIDSILSSVSEDAAEFGACVRFVGGCKAHARIKLQAFVRCLNNLIDNAIKYAGSAELSSEYDDEGLVVMVRDYGPGIPAPMLQDAFEPFRRLGSAQPIPVSGTGIGLTIALALARTFDARLTLENTVDGGLLARIKLSR